MRKYYEINRHKITNDILGEVFKILEILNNRRGYNNCLKDLGDILSNFGDIDALYKNRNIQLKDVMESYYKQIRSQFDSVLKSLNQIKRFQNIKIINDERYFDSDMKIDYDDVLN